MSAEPSDSTRGLVEELLAQIQEDERLSALIGTSLVPADARPEHAPAARLPLDEWLKRSEEVHRFLRTARRAELASRR